MPKVKTNRVNYPEGWELIEPTLRDLQAKMREAENDPHDNKRKCEALWPIFKIAHQRSRYVFDLYHRRKEISKELYEFCLDQGYADRNLIAKWKKPGYERLCCLRPPAFAVSRSICEKRRSLSAFIAAVEVALVEIEYLVECAGDDKTIGKSSDDIFAHSRP
ncbi:protein bud31 homolog 2 [Phtheirospermum japonicum]|uniref:Protein bud31 homolog 2 n=1 Tax=Phtheirospermum japonicum TaxID=374723 RepID=A0A830DDP5_9LAMI|nr:protein bud31 homolog 2 [Phtheirospermum japonicum]